MSELFSRRSFLKLSGALVTASALAACSGGGGGGSAGGGGTGGGGSIINVDGLLIGKNYLQPQLAGNKFGLAVSLKSLTGDAITLSKNTSFANIKFNETTANVTGFGQFNSTTDTVEITSEEKTVTVWFDADITSGQTYTISFDLIHGNQKAVFKGTRPDSTWSVTVQNNS